MIRIGDFSKLSRVTIKTLRYYDEVGLLKPAHVDKFTGYRYYTYNQLPRLNRILALKDLGFSLEEIKGLLTEDLPPEQMRGMLKLRQSEISQRIQDEEERLGRVETRLRQIEREEVMSAYDVITKEVDPIKVATVRGVVPTPPDQGRLWGRLETYLRKHDVESRDPCFSLYHDDEYKEKDWDIEVCAPIKGDAPETEQVKVRSLPKVETMACVVHHGPFVTISDAYDALMKWIDENGYQIVGPGREVYLRTANGGSQTDPETITEVQYPVNKV